MVYLLVTTYLIQNKINGKYYFGQTTRSVDDRWYEHLYDAQSGSPSYLYYSMRKHGKENFTVTELSCCTTQEELDKAEVFLIWLLGSHKSFLGYNVRMGGSPGKYSEAAKKEFRRLVQARMLTLTVEQKFEMTVPARKRFKELRDLGIMVGGRTEPHKPESIELMRLAKLGTTQTEESNIKRSKTLTGRKLGEEHRINTSKGATKAWSEQTEEQITARSRKQGATLSKTLADRGGTFKTLEQQKEASEEMKRRNANGQAKRAGDARWAKHRATKAILATANALLTLTPLPIAIILPRPLTGTGQLMPFSSLLDV